MYNNKTGSINHNLTNIQAAAADIKPASIIDLGSLIKIEKICFGKDAWPLLDLVAVLSMPGIVRLKAMDGKNLIGFVSGDIKPGENLGWITSICVLPNYQGQGIGRVLLAQCEELMNMPVVRLCVRLSNHTAIHLYKSHGYRQVNVWPAYYYDKEDGLIFEKERS